MTHQTTAEIREQLRGMALSLATGSGPIVEPGEFDAALDAYRSAALREAIAAARQESERLSREMSGDAAYGARAVAKLLRRMADETATETPAAETRQSDGPGRIVAYRSLGGRILRCLNHIPPEPEGDFVPVTAEDLPDGGICTYPTPTGSLSLRCGVDVLTAEPAAGARQDGAQR
ncbi:hypothetical protein [Streptomyces pseudogriseolus]|uniref:hypothetical protein n=1 Tax=Streptomyces pseudogriseolus TaxID=36817 RepID=UPI003FA2285F